MSSNAVLERHKKAHRLIQSPLRGYIQRQSDDLWLAECIDLDITVKAKNSHLAKKALSDAVTGYLQTALQGDPEGLILRPSPLSHRLFYHWLCLRAAMSISGRQGFCLYDLAECV